MRHIGHFRFSMVACMAMCCASLACGGSGDDESSSSSAGATSSQETQAEAEAGTEAGTASGSEASTETTGEPPGVEYGPCTSIVDCPEGMLYVCLQNVTEGAVCAPGCMEHSDCPPPPPGGSTAPVCTVIDDRTRCAMLGCSQDEDCPTGMTCHIEGPNWCHWPV